MVVLWGDGGTANGFHLFKDPSIPLQGHEAGTHKGFFFFLNGGFYDLGDPVLQGRKHITKLQQCDSTS